ncbi:hypothetical protein FAY30_25220 [Bacillus sp. S3]|nr:hypothetical protein FAY30_25220 [Bacillus sp. S3]
MIKRIVDFLTKRFGRMASVAKDCNLQWEKRNCKIPMELKCYRLAKIVDFPIAYLEASWVK